MDRASRTVVALADDLTGAGACAAELAGTIVPWDALGPAPVAPRTVVDCASRALPPSASAQRLLDVLAGLDRLGGVRIYKRVDSRLRGRVGDEFAVLSERGARLLLAPAAPSLGVHTVDGVQLAGGEPVNHVPRHGEPGPESPRPADLLAGKPCELSVDAVRSAGLRDLIGAAFADGQNVVCDSETAADLEAIGRAAASFPACVPVGSYGLAAPWADAVEGRDRAPGVVVAVGSPRPESRSQVERLVAAGAVAAAPAEAEALLRSGHDLVLEGSAADGRTAALRAVVEAVRPAGLVLVGGELASDVVQACGTTRTAIVGEPWPATPLVRFEGGLLDGIPGILKSGALGGPDGLVEAVGLLRCLAPGAR